MDQERQATVLFADVSGSTKLYESEGDKAAMEAVARCLDQLRQKVEASGGRVVKTIGDEVMALFPTPDSAAIAASSMQYAIEALPLVGATKLGVRIGFQSGPVIQSGDDVFGDTVNLAARLVEQARRSQIITSRETSDRLGPIFRSFKRPLYAIHVKGKAEAVELCELIWRQADDVTMAVGARTEIKREPLVLRPSLTEDLRIGARAGFGHPIVGATFRAFAIDDFANGFFMALYMLYGLRTLSIDVATMGIVISLGGLGALAGAFVASAVSRRLGFGRAMIVTFLIGKFANLFVAFASIAPQFAVAWLSASQLFSDGAMVAFLILANSYRQTVLPLDVMARANGLLEVMTGILLPLGALIAGLLAKATSVTFAVWVGCVLGLFAVVPLLRPRIVSLATPVPV